MLDRNLPFTLTFDDVLLVPAASNVLPHEVSLETRLTTRIRLPIPFLSSAMDTVTEGAMGVAMAMAGGIGVIHRNLSIEEQAAAVAQVKSFQPVGEKIPPYAAVDSEGRLMAAAAVGTSDDTRARVDALLAAGCDVIVADTAHGHSHKVIATVARLREELPELHLIAGNVATPEATEALIEAGADAVKVGVGPGSICTTRVVAGVGVPQLTAVSECVEVATKHDVPIIADGGVRFAGDAVKAIAAGASTVMVGGMLAGTDESPGEVITIQGNPHKTYRGMGSRGAMLRGSSDRYFQQGAKPEELVPEGVEGSVPYRGPAARVLHKLVGGLRAGMGYTGCADISTLQQKARFVRISPAGLRESHPHDLTTTE